MCKTNGTFPSKVDCFKVLPAYLFAPVFEKKKKKILIKKHLIAYISILFISNICNQISTILHLHIMCDGDLFLNHYLQKMFFFD